MEQILLIGDVHQKNTRYESIIEAHRGDSIQLGDFGFETEHKWMLKYKDCERNKVLFGNHDDYNFVNEKHSLGHFGLYKGLFFVRGAYSYDKANRIARGYEWHENEELSYEQANECIELYEQEKPIIVISHECPTIIRTLLWDMSERSRTSDLLEAMFDIHKPTMWIFGHHHKSVTEVINGCEFTCLAELETKLISLSY
jgi:predicted phosphodiesterase